MRVTLPLKPVWKTGASVFCQCRIEKLSVEEFGQLSLGFLVVVMRDPCDVDVAVQHDLELPSFRSLEFFLELVVEVDILVELLILVVLQPFVPGRELDPSKRADVHRNVARESRVFFKERLTLLVEGFEFSKSLGSKRDDRVGNVPAIRVRGLGFDYGLH